MSDSSTPAVGELARGTLLGNRYRLLELIGQGGMGAVWKATNIATESTVCIKVLLQKQPDAAALMRFGKESQALARLDHPNILKVYTLDRDQLGRLFLVTDFVDGKSLDKFSQGELSTRRLVGIFRQVAQALQYAHENGVVHRDIKPSNVLVVQQPNRDVVKLVDFGIAQIARENAGQRLTQTGALLGTPDYMSPEQCQGRKVDARSDIYSLGCVMYQRFVGRNPFQGESAFETFALHSNLDRAQLTAVVADSRLARILDRCLAIDPVQRFQSAGELDGALADIGDAISDQPPALSGAGKTAAPKLIRIPTNLAFKISLVLLTVLLVPVVMAISCWTFWQVNQTEAAGAFLSGKWSVLRRCAPTLVACSDFWERRIAVFLPADIRRTVNESCTCSLCLAAIARLHANDFAGAEELAERARHLIEDWQLKLMAPAWLSIVEADESMANPKQGSLWNKELNDAQKCCGKAQRFDLLSGLYLDFVHYHTRDHLQDACAADCMLLKQQLGRDGGLVLEAAAADPDNSTAVTAELLVAAVDNYEFWRAALQAAAINEKNVTAKQALMSEAALDEKRGNAVQERLFPLVKKLGERDTNVATLVLMHSLSFLQNQKREAEILPFIESHLREIPSNDIAARLSFECLAAAQLMSMGEEKLGRRYWNDVLKRGTSFDNKDLTEIAFNARAVFGTCLLIRGKVDESLPLLYQANQYFVASGAGKETMVVLVKSSIDEALAIRTAQAGDKPAFVDRCKKYFRDLRQNKSRFVECIQSMLDSMRLSGGAGHEYALLALDTAKSFAEGKDEQDKLVALRTAIDNAAKNEEKQHP